MCEQSLQDMTLEYLEKNGVKKNFFAKRVGISPSMLSQWFVGKVVLKEKTLLAIHSIVTK